MTVGEQSVSGLSNALINTERDQTNQDVSIPSVKNAETVSFVDIEDDEC